MKDHYDPWYVRLPDSRTIKAKSTASVRHHVEAGHIPLNSLLRRTADDEWVELRWQSEFADLGSPTPPRPERTPETSRNATPAGRSGVSARLDPMRLQTVGVRGLIDELIAALDSTLTRTKIVPALFAGVVLCVGMSGMQWLADDFFTTDEDRHVFGMVFGAALAVVVLSVLNALLARLTHLELTTMRTATLKDGLRGGLGYSLQVLIAQALIAGGGLGLLYALQMTPYWLKHAGMDLHTIRQLYPWVSVVIVMLSVVIWLIIGLCWLLTPAIVVEESSWLAGLREWRQLLRDHFGRILVYEGLALFMGLVVAMPLTIAVNLSLYNTPTIFPRSPMLDIHGQHEATLLVRSLLHGTTIGPLLATMAVANVFIYLNLRYEAPAAK